MVPTSIGHSLALPSGHRSCTNLLSYVHTHSSVKAPRESNTPTGSVVSCSLNARLLLLQSAGGGKQLSSMHAGTLQGVIYEYSRAGQGDRTRHISSRPSTTECHLQVGRQHRLHDRYSGRVPPSLVLTHGEATPMTCRPTYQRRLKRWQHERVFVETSSDGRDH